MRGGQGRKAGAVVWQWVPTFKEAVPPPPRVPSITILMNALRRNKEVFFPLCDGCRLFLSMALSIAVSHNYRCVGTLWANEGSGQLQAQPIYTGTAILGSILESDASYINIRKCMLVLSLEIKLTFFAGSYNSFL